LKLDFFEPSLPLMLDIEDGVGRNQKPLAADLKTNRLAAFQGVGDAPQFFDELVPGICLLDIPSGFVFHPPLH
jgi:hypothetical protein